MQNIIPQYIDHHAQRLPEKIAVKFYDDELSYALLSQRSDALAACLLGHGLQHGDRVGIYLGKSLESIVAVYGIMKAGGAYVPIDPASPALRVEQLIRDCGIRQLVSADCHLAVLQQLAETDCGLQQILGITASLDGDANSINWSDIALTPTTALDNIQISEHDLAYIIYTSGTTGTPKGIMHTHKSGLSFAHWAVGTYEFGPEDRLANQAPLHFDMSVFDFFSAAVAGATAVIIPDEYLKMPASYSSLLAQENVTAVFTVPFALSQLLHRGLPEQRDLQALRWIIFGGDTHSPEHIGQLMQLLPQTRFSHMYGPAETNGCTFHNIETLPEDPKQPISIGRPCENMEGLVLNENDLAVKVGEVGELLMRGPTLMQGYWNRPDLDARAFWQLPGSNGNSQRYYRTGDLVEALAGGAYRFAGRVDRQVKVRGYRVELDEIEMALCAHPAVEEAAAFVVSGAQDSRHIEAAVILNSSDASEHDLLKAIKRRLPPYALPVRIARLQDFPRTGSGKISRVQLQALAANRSPG